MKISKIDDMINTLRSETMIRKSIRLANAVAIDYEKCFGSKAVGLIGNVKRGKNPVPGVFVRGTVYKAGNMWEVFFRKEDAENFCNLAKKCISSFWERNHKVIEQSKDFGLLEIMIHLKDEGSTLDSTLEVYEKLLLNNKYGL